MIISKISTELEIKKNLSDKITVPYDKIDIESPVDYVVVATVYIYSLVSASIGAISINFISNDVYSKTKPFSSYIVLFLSNFTISV